MECKYYIGFIILDPFSHKLFMNLNSNIYINYAELTLELWIMSNYTALFLLDIIAFYINIYIPLGSLLN